MKKCHHCKSGLSAKDVFCTECGEVVRDDAKPVSRYCENCGKPYEDDGAFCTNCGTSKIRQPETALKTEELPVEQEKNVVAPPVEPEQAAAVNSHEPEKQEAAPTQKPVSRGRKKPMSKWKKFFIVFGIIILTLGVSTYMYLKSYYDPMKELTKLDEVMVDGDIDEFYNLINVDEDVIYDKSNYFAYIKDVEWNEGVKANYLAMLEQEEENPTSLQKDIGNNDGETIFKVRDKKILFGLFKKYQLTAVPVKIAATANMEKTKLKVESETFELEKVDDTKELGDFYPGEYTFEAVTKTDYGDISIKNDYDIDPAESREIDFKFESKSFSVDVDADYDDAILYVNGESTKKKISEMDEVGPVPLEGEVKVYAEWKDDDEKAYRSRTVKLEDDLGGYAYLEFDEQIKLDAKKAEDEDYDLAEYILDFRGAYENAVNFADYDEIEDFMKPDTEEEKDLKKFVSDMDDADYYYEFGDNTVTKVKQKDDKTFEVETNETFIFHDDDGSVYDYDRDKLYSIEQADDEYKITNIDYKDTKKKRIN